MNNGWLTKIVDLFIKTRLSILLIIVSLALGAAALFAMPKEEDPQIVVPMADIMVNAPGINAKEVNNLVATPLAKLLWQVKGVEDVYATSKAGQALVTVRFFVGTNQEQALVRLHNQLDMHQDIVPSIVKNWVVKPISINDVPIVNIVLYSQKYSDYALHRIGQELLHNLEKLPNISKTELIGGRFLQARIQFDPSHMAGFGVTPLEVYHAVQQADTSIIAGSIDQKNQQFTIKTQSLLHNSQELKDLVVTTHNGKPVYLRDVAKVVVGPSEASSYSFFHLNSNQKLYNAVSIGLAKKSGSNAVSVANSILSQLNTLAPQLLPSGVHYKITRNYGQTAHRKVDELINSLGLAILTVVLVLVISLGWRESLIVALSVPISFALAIFVDFLFGYSINRVTLFALILSLGLVVDDPITNVENIQRHIRLGKEKIHQAILSAVNEVLPPVIMASLTIIVSFLPLFFITGMMGPYMAPMAATVPLTIIFSTVAALTIVPWLANKLLKHRQVLHESVSLASHNHDTVPAWVRKYYSKIVTPFLESRKKRYGLLVAILALLMACGGIVFLGGVPLKLLPFDNKNSLQLVIDMPAGTTLEQTHQVVMDYANVLNHSKYITSYTTYTGIASPMDFNSMVRHYYLRNQANQATIRINLIDKSKRHLQSHGVGLLLRNQLQQVAKTTNSKLSIVEMPPGPPVMQTIVAEVTGDSNISYAQIIKGAKYVETLLAKQHLVVDVNDSTVRPHQDITYQIDKEKAAINGISTATITQTLQLALGLNTPMTLHRDTERAPLTIKFEIPRNQRADINTLRAITVKNNQGQLIPLISLGHFIKVAHAEPIIQKNLERTVYVMANTAGRPPANVVLDMEKLLKNQPALKGIHVNFSGEGAWKITVRVFRDMGIGFAAAMAAIYILLFIQTDSFMMPLLMMIAIPLTIIGIIPGFWLLNVIANHLVGGYPTPIFFTATSMIGMIALGGIVIRNSVILVDFMDKAIAKGMSLKEAVLESGATRLRPIVLTALTAALGAWPITLDPIFSGLAWALIFGLIASTSFTLLVIPVTYYALKYKGNPPLK